MEPTTLLSATKHQKGEFTWYDYLIFVATLAISMGIGIYYACSGDKNRTTNSYLLANRRLRVFPSALSMFMSYVSAIMVLGNTAEMYTYGVTQMMSLIGATIGFILSALFIVPIIFPLRLTSAYEYLEMRYQSKAVRKAGSLILLFGHTTYIGVALYSPATALEAVTPIPAWISITVMGIVGTIYTTIGGMKAVVWTDVFQGFVMFTGALIALVLGTEKAGGIGQVWQRAADSGRLDLNWDPNPFVRMNVWSTILPPILSYIDTVGLSQTSVQRYSNMESVKQAQMSALLNIPLLFLSTSITCLCGFAVFAYYDSIECDILRTPLVRNPNQLLPFFIVNDLNVPALPGLFIAVLFGGALSSTSSSMTSLSTVTWNDFLKPSVIYGCLGMAFAFAVQNIPGHVMQISTTVGSAFGGPMLGMFLLGLLFPCANWIGALFGCLIAFAISLAVMIGNNVEAPYIEYINMTTSNCSALGYNASAMPQNPDDVFILFKLSFQLFGVLGVTVCVLAGVVISLIAAAISKTPVQSEVNPKLLLCVYKGCICLIPDKLRIKLGLPTSTEQLNEIEGKEPGTNISQDNSEVNHDKVPAMKDQPNLQITQAEKEVKENLSDGMPKVLNEEKKYSYDQS